VTAGGRRAGVGVGVDGGGGGGGGVEVQPGRATVDVGVDSLGRSLSVSRGGVRARKAAQRQLGRARQAVAKPSRARTRQYCRCSCATSWPEVYSITCNPQPRRTGALGWPQEGSRSGAPLESLQARLDERESAQAGVCDKRCNQQRQVCDQAPDVHGDDAVRFYTTQRTTPADPRRLAEGLLEQTSRRSIREPQHAC
jgi:hypothetical protein